MIVIIFYLSPLVFFFYFYVRYLKKIPSDIKEKDKTLGPNLAGTSKTKTKENQFNRPPDPINLAN